LVGNKKPADSYAPVRLWLVRGLGFVYFVAFAIVFFQGAALWGKDGLLPIGSFIEAVVRNSGGRDAAFWHLPSLFYFGASDSLIWGLGLIGMVLAVVACDQNSACPPKNFVANRRLYAAGDRMN
jgi:hypothetical protein